jgi:hypothetical protein
MEEKEAERGQKRPGQREGRINPSLIFYPDTHGGVNDEKNERVKIFGDVPARSRDLIHGSVRHYMRGNQLRK